MEVKKIVYAHIPVDEIKGKLVRNPAYNDQKVSLNGWCWISHEPTHRKPMFQKALGESLKKEGVRNPIILYGLPEGFFLCFGGSRLRAARDVGLETIPALVNDYTGKVEGVEVTEENVRDFFKDPPKYLTFNESGVDYHYGLERKRRDVYDGNGLAWAEDMEFVSIEFPWIEDD